MMTIRTPVIVSRHPGTIAYLREQIPELAKADVLSGDLLEEDILDKDVYGNIPLRLAALARSYTHVEFPAGCPQKGKREDYTLEELRDTGLVLRRLVVREYADEPIRTYFCMSCDKDVLAERPHGACHPDSLVGEIDGTSTSGQYPCVLRTTYEQALFLRGD